MRISVVGGMDRLEPHYRNEVEKLGYELGLFTGKISHEARNQVVAAAKANNIPLLQCHYCGVCTLRDCLSCFASDETYRPR
jgi:hypothetical protein